MTALTFLSVCSGIEAASAAWSPLGFRPVGFAEIEPFPSAVLAHHYGANLPGEALASNGVPNHGDFTRIDLSAVPRPLDILVGGTPCQAFSIAGRRLSLEDARGNLTLSFVELAHGLSRTHGLRSVIWENVPGVLSTKDNAFGCFLGALVGADAALHPPGGAGWPGAGMVAGPRSRAAWRVLDAQYFGLPQRRKRVFLVGDLGGGADPAAVLFERQSLLRHPPARRQAGQGSSADAPAGAGELRAFGGHDGRLAGTVSAKWAKGTGGPAGDEVQNMVAHALTGEGFDASEDGTGRGVPLVPVLAIQERAVAENPNAGPDGVGIQDGVAYTLEARQQVQAVAFAENQRNEIREMHVSGALAGIRRGDAKNETLLAISFSCKDHGGDVTDDLAPTLRAMGHRESHANSGGQLAVAFDMRGRAGGAQFEGPHDTTSLRAAEGGSSRSYVATRWAVRRLTPRECERLQGFPDDYTAISWRGRPAEACPDGPRYKALGNAMAVPVMRWIGTRLAAAMPERAAP